MNEKYRVRSSVLITKEQIWPHWYFHLVYLQLENVYLQRQKYTICYVCYVILWKLGSLLLKKKKFCELEIRLVNKISWETAPHDVCDLSRAYFYPRVCQGVRVQSHASNDQDWLKESRYFETAKRLSRMFRWVI